MQATPAPTPADIAAQLAVETLQAHRTALQTLEKLMLHAAGALMNPTEEQKNEDPAQARTATQRLRLVMQAARDILRFGGIGEPPRSPRPRATPATTSTTTQPNNAAHETNNLLAAAGRAFGSDERTKAWPVSSGAERMKTGSEAVPEGLAQPSEATQSVNPSSRFGKQTSPPLPRDSSLIAHNSAAHDSPPSPPHAPQPALIAPEPFHKDEVAYIVTQLQRSNRHLPLNLYNKAKAWHDYTTATGVESPYNFYWPQILKHEPGEPLDVIRR